MARSLARTNRTATKASDARAVTIGCMRIGDYPEVIALWRRCEGIGLSAADTREGITRYLKRNPRMSLVARDRGTLVGTILCGHDGRRGYIHHVAVHPAYRRQHIATRLVKRCLAILTALGIQKSHLFILSNNAQGKRFWQRIGWILRKDIEIVSRDL